MCGHAGSHRTYINIAMPTVWFAVDSQKAVPVCAQSAAATVAESHPKGIDYLVINAGLADNHIGPTLELCATCPHLYDVV